MEPRAIVVEDDTAERPLHRDGRLAGRARPARRHVQGAEGRSEDAARPHPRRRRRLRHQGLQLSRISAGREGGEGARPAGEMGLRPQRAFPRRRAWPRPRHDRPTGARRERPHPGAPGRYRRQHGLLLQPVRRDHPVVRDRHDDRRLRHPDGARRLQGRLHPQRADRRLSRRRPPGGGVPDRAPDGRGGARHRPFADRDPPAEFHPARADALQDGDRQRLRYRRVRRAHGPVARARRGGRLRGAARREQGARDTSAALASAPTSRSAPSRARSRPRRCSRRTARSASTSARSRPGRGIRPPMRSSSAGPLGLDYDRIRVVQGDSDALPTRRRHRRLALDPARRALGRPRVAARSPSRSRQIAADELEAGVGDIELVGRHGARGRHRPQPLLRRDRRSARRTRPSSSRSASSRRRSRPTRTARMSARSRSIRRPAAPRCFATRSSTISARR